MAHQGIDPKATAALIKATVKSSDHIQRMAKSAMEAAAQADRVAYNTIAALSHPESKDTNYDQVNVILAEADWHRAVVKELQSELV